MTILSENMVYSKTRTQNLSNVKQLNAWGSELTDVSIVRSMPFVQVLSLSVNQISSLEDFSACRNLKELYLRDNKIRDLDQVYHLQDLPFLRKLFLSGNPCADRPDYRKTVLRILPHLESLDNVTVTPEEVAQAEMATEPFERERRSPLEPRQSSPDQAEEEDYEDEDEGAGSNCSGQIRESSVASSECNLKNSSPQVVLRRQRNSYQEGVHGDNWAATNSPQTRNAPKHATPNAMVRSQSVADYTMLNGHLPLSTPKSGPRSASSDKSRRLLPKGGKNRSSNILSAVLCLIKELDAASLEVVDTEVHCRIEELTE